LINKKNIIGYIIPVALVIFYCLPERFFVSGLNEESYCLHKSIFGVECPGCGLTRAIYYMLHVSFNKAIGLNAAVVFAFPVMIGEIGYRFQPAQWIIKTRFILYLCFCLALLLLYLIRIYHSIIHP